MRTVLAITLTVVVVVLAADLCSAQQMSTDGLNPEQKKIIENYESISKLNYGDECSADLEAKGNTVRENLKPYLKKLFGRALEHGLSGNENEFELTQSLEDARDELFAEIAEYTAKVQNSPAGVNGICNDTKTLYCDKEAGQCRCGKAKAVKGFTFGHHDGSCKFEVGSGCVQEEFKELSAIGCKKGSKCLTVIDNVACNFENSFAEALDNPSRFRRILQQTGYACFCDKEKEALE